MSSFTIDNLPALESHLANNQYVSGADKPDANDTRIFQALQAKKMVPEQSKFPNIYAWFGWINMFNPEKVASFGGAAAAPKKEAKQAKKETKKEDDDVDLFGSDDEDDAEAEAAAEKRRQEIVAKHQANKKKKEVIAKTIILLDVKVFELEQDLAALAEKIYNEIQIDGLVWNREPKFEKIAFGMSKLIVTCVVEDAKVLSDDIIERITAWEDEVQSVDINNMQKL